MTIVRRARLTFLSFLLFSFSILPSFSEFGSLFDLLVLPFAFLVLIIKLFTSRKKQFNAPRLIKCAVLSLFLILIVKSILGAPFFPGFAIFLRVSLFLMTFSWIGFELFQADPLEIRLVANVGSFVLSSIVIILFIASLGSTSSLGLGFPFYSAASTDRHVFGPAMMVVSITLASSFFATKSNNHKSHAFCNLLRAYYLFSALIAFGLSLFSASRGGVLLLGLFVVLRLTNAALIIAKSLISAHTFPIRIRQASSCILCLLLISIIVIAINASSNLPFNASFVNRSFEIFLNKDIITNDASRADHFSNTFSDFTSFNWIFTGFPSFILTLDSGYAYLPFNFGIFPSFFVLTGFICACFPRYSCSLRSLMISILLTSVAASEFLFIPRFQILFLYCYSVYLAFGKLNSVANLYRRSSSLSL